MAEQSKAMLVEYKFTRSDGRPLTAEQQRKMDDSMFELIGTWAQKRRLMVEGQALFERFADGKQDAPLTAETTPELKRVDRACRAVSASITEFGTITDPELIDELDAALDELLLPEQGRRPSDANALINTFGSELIGLHEKKAAGVDTEGDHVAFLGARHDILTALMASSRSESGTVPFELLDLRQQMQTLIWHSATLLPPDLYWVQQWQKRMGRIAHALGADLATLPHGREATLDKPEGWLMSLTGLIDEPEVIIPLDLAREIGLIVRHHVADLACNNETGNRTETVKRAEVAFTALVQTAWEAQQPEPGA